MKVRIDNVRLAFCNLHEARAGDAAKPNDKKFSTACLFEAADPEVTFLPSKEEREAGVKPKRMKMSQVINEAAAAKWGTKAPTMLKALRAGHKALVLPGALKAQYEGYDGMHFLNASNKARPTLIDQQKTPLTAADGKPYSGCFANVTVDVWAQDNQYGQRINASLLGVQFASDGPAFSGGVTGDEEDFEPIADGAQADDLG